MSKKKEIKETKEKKEKVEKFNITFISGSANSEEKGAKELYDQSRFGESKEGKILYSLVEALYLLEKGKADILDGKKKLKANEFIKKAVKNEPNFLVRYVVFSDMRNRGYIIKTALKFGADFRVYDRGIKPGEDHAKWILYPVREAEVFSWYNFSAKNRVAHSTRKRLLIAIVDEENDVTYYTIAWTRP
ncbi:MAG: tRNA-intron lyase [Nanoarchaeota archaeon]|nr:tRNA-intron lyase [Nanoarchaeota archaeon]